MTLRWPFRRRRSVVVVPAALPLEEYRAMCMGREILLMADHILNQTRFTPVAAMRMDYQTPEGGHFEVSVAAKAPDRPTFDEPVRQS